VDIEPLEVYSRDSNYAVIKPPGRNFPGCVRRDQGLGSITTHPWLMECRHLRGSKQTCAAL
jgi:hypothetical protein